MSSSKKRFMLVLLFCAFVTELSFAQERNPTTWPYGGVPDSSRYNSLYIERVPYNYIDMDYGFTHFDSVADFRKALFKGLAGFWGTKFFNDADFSKASFRGIADFSGAILNYADFRGAEIDSFVDFSYAALRDTVLIGTQFSNKIQKYDLTNAILLPAHYIISSIDSHDGYIRQETFYPGTKIIIYGPVDLKMQLEKLAFVELCDTLDYFAKKDIITVLKEQSFKNNKAAQFEFDYMFAKSTKYQKVSVIYENYSAFHPHAWLQFLYNATMGLGYRPFRLIWWALGLVLGFGVFYIFKMPDRINRYILKDEKKSKPDMTAPWFGCKS